MIMNGKEISNEIKEKLINEVSKLEKKPGLAVIQVGQDEASSIYVKAKKQLALEIGYDFQHLIFPENVSEETLIAKIRELNNDQNVNGIIVQLPIPEHLDIFKIINEIDSLKDIDGLTVINVGKLCSGSPDLISCTPLGIMTMLNYYHIDLTGKHVVIVGRSNLVGKPLVSLCLGEDATVTVCHSKTSNLEQFTKEADVLIVAVGKRNLITKDMIKEGAVIVDVGINRYENHIYGDVDFDAVKDIASYITPVPGGVGRMTTISLMQNVLSTYKIMSKRIQ